MYLFRCKKCGKIYKTQDGQYTDFGDKIYLEDAKEWKICPNCGSLSTNCTMKTDEWIANLLFKVKG